jgi:hypothetical protein
MDCSYVREGDQVQHQTTVGVLHRLRLVSPCASDPLTRRSNSELLCCTALVGFGTVLPNGHVRIHGEYWRVSGLSPNIGNPAPMDLTPSIK